MEIYFNEQVNYILDILNKYGKGYLVGGAIRDKILGHETKDFDFATDIDINILLDIFKKYNPYIVNRKYNIISFKIEQYKVEIARFRQDIGIYDGRNPITVKFIDNIYDDLIRRDISINAFAYNKDGLIDIFNSMEDIKNKKIRLIGKVEDRLKEDYTRIFRIFRFVSTLGFDIEEQTLIEIKEISKNKYIFSNLSKQQLFYELERILFNKYSYKAIKLMVFTDIFKHFFKEFDISIMDKELLMDICKIMKRYSKLKLYEDKELGYALLFSLIGKQELSYNDRNDKYAKGYEMYSMNIVEKYLRYYSYPTQKIYNIKNLIYYHTIIFKNPSFNMLKKMLLDLNNNKNIAKLITLITTLYTSIINKDEIDSINKKIMIFLDKIQKIYSTEEVVFINDIDINTVDLYNLRLNINLNNERLRREIYNEIIKGNLDNVKEDILKYIFEKYNIKKELPKEKCAGAIVYKIEDKEIKFLLVKILSGNWGFSKGHIEMGENSYKAAIRELKEETNIDIEIIYKEKFAKSIKYITDQYVFKKVKYFIAKAINDDVIIDENEIEEYKWCNYKEALKTITYIPQRNLLKSAVLYILGEEENEK